MKHRNQTRDPRPGRPSADEIRKTTQALQNSDIENPSEHQNRKEKQHPARRH